MKYKIIVIYLVLQSAFTTLNAQTLNDGTELKRPQFSGGADLQARIERLERGVAAMQKQVYSDNNKNTTKVQASAPNQNVDAQFEELYQQIKGIRGDIEQLQFENTKLNEKFVKFVADVEYRFNDVAQHNNSKDNNTKELSKVEDQLTENQALEGSDQKALQQKANNESQDSSKQSDSKKDKSGDQASAEDKYQEAYTALKERDFDKANSLFENFVKVNGNNQLAGSAFFWLGEISFQKADYDNAAIKYLKGYQQNTKGTRAADNLLKLGESLSMLKKKKEACLTFIKLKKEFPSASSSIKKKADEQIISLKCQS